ncbi:methyltransferase [Metarhizium robertsii]|uniref:Methyltransferase domain-containing protein n=2 Tax=Metarhizium robertsii TaxID=568076 RepID=E9FAV8_METRA|nr:methyltransferase domain-containing protein [Metarhizium robertsii ARSEF 23]EFY95080.1 methyltransferase domain-containing protein [Metarhizium robertsii ARSEF 23]EXU96523.1 methyltransferase [Metarhizium robertsii]
MDSSPPLFIKDEHVKDLPEPALELLETYANIPAQDVIPHVLTLPRTQVDVNDYQRNEAFVLHPWPCIGRLRFLCPSLPTYAAYPRILTKLKSDSSAALLDVGCCFGQDLRKLVLDGVDPSQLAALDLVPEFYEMGKRLFRDGDKLHIDFYGRDIFDSGADWEPLRQRFDIIHMTSFLHIWNWRGQVGAARRIVQFVKPKPGSLLVGSGLGSVVGEERPALQGMGVHYRQSEESFARLWKEVGDVTGTKWKVQSRFHGFQIGQQNQGQGAEDANVGWLTFEVHML